MRESLENICSSFIENRTRIKSAFSWEDSYIYPACAAIFTDKQQLADIDKMKNCKELLKKQTGVFSSFRGTIKLVMISKLAVSDDPSATLHNTLSIYDTLKEYFSGSPYLPLASIIIAELTTPDRYDEIAARTRHIYDLMKQEHRFLTSQEDSVFAALLALSTLSNEQVIDETESCYRILKEQFSSGDAVQSLSHVLALNEGSAPEKAAKTIDMYDALKSNGYKYGTNYELATLGVLSLLPAEQSCVIDDIIEVNNFLSSQKGFGFLDISKKQRLMYAGMLVASDYIGANSQLATTTAALSSTISLIIAQQVAICVVIAASSAAAVSSSSSN